MKQIFKKIGICAVFVTLALNVFGEPIDKNKAIAVGTHFLNGYRKGPSAMELKVKETSYRNLYILVPTEGRGFVIVAGDDAARPILGYSLEQEITDDNPNLREWLQMYDNSIGEIEERNLSATEKIREQWELLEEGLPEGSSKETRVEPLLTTQWNQSPFYNAQCPYDEEVETRTLAGCGAIAMAQVMKYWNYPGKGYGSEEYTHTRYGTLSADFGGTVYDWEHMPDRLTSSSSEAEVEAVSTLVYHAAVGLHMVFSPYNSSSNLSGLGDFSEPAIDNALMNYFKYSSGLMYHNKRAYSDEEWTALMKNDLDRGMPIVYRGYDEYNGGHLFVCDGYDENGLFHFNWGWAGSGDGYYAVDNLNPQSFDYSQYCMMINNIRPLSDSSSRPTVRVTSNNEDWGIAEGNTRAGYGERVTIEASPKENYKFTHWSDGSEYSQRQVPAFGTFNIEANFAPIAGDTMYYCSQNHIQSRGYGVNNTCYWGIAIPKTSLQPGRQLTSIEFYCVAPSTYTLSIVQNFPWDTPIVSKNFRTDTTDAWVTVPLDTPIPISTENTLCIVLHSSPSVGYPAAYSPFCGHTHSCFIGDHSSSLRSYSFGSFMIKINTTAESDPEGIESAESRSYTVTTQGGEIIVTGAEGRGVELYDIQGRRIFVSDRASHTERVAAPTRGMYIVKVGSDKPQKALIAKAAE